MKVVVESPKARVVYDSPKAALDALTKWLANAREGQPCVAITVALHSEGDACDHDS